MSWRLSHALESLRDQVNAEWPHRDKRSDGTIGDAAHAASKSDHNPDEFGIVRALDLTDDPDGNGPSAAWLAETIRASRDPRVLYIISQGRIASSYPTTAADAWAWRPYHGVNAHTSHVHISVVPGDLGDEAGAWTIDATDVPVVKPRQTIPAVMAPRWPLPTGWYFGPRSGPAESVSGYYQRLENGRRGHRGLLAWQRRMVARGWDLACDGLYGDQTAAVTRAFQAEKGLTVDGKIGVQTWRAAWQAKVTR